MRRQITSILSGWDSILPDSLDSSHKKGRLTIPDLLNLLNKYKSTIQVVEQIKKELEEHINDKNNPHNTILDPSEYNITYLLYLEYTKHFKYTKPFSDFVYDLYHQIEYGTVNDINDPDSIGNRYKVSTIQTVDAFIKKHNDSSDAHPELRRTLTPGDLFEVYPRIIMNPKHNNSNLNPTYQDLWLLSGKNGLIKQVDDDLKFDYSFNEPLIPLFQPTTNYISNSENVSQAQLINTTNVINQSYIPDLRNNHNYLSLRESVPVSNIERGLQLPLSIPNNKYMTLSVYYYPILRDMFQIQLNNNVVLRIQPTQDLSSNNPVIITNTTGKQIYADIVQLSNGYYRISVTFYNNFNCNNCKINFLQFMDGGLEYTSNPNYMAGIFYQFQIENSLIASPPVITGSSISSRGMSYGFSKLNSLRNVEQGTIYVELYKYNPLNYGQIFDISLYNKHIEAYLNNNNLSIVSFVNGKSYSKTFSNIPSSKVLKLVISYGNSGLIYGTSFIDNPIIEGDDSYTQIPELNILTSDVNDINENDVLKLNSFPHVVLKTVNKLNDSMDNVVKELIPQLAALKDNNDLIAINLLPSRCDNTILGVDRFPSDSDYIYIGTNSSKNKFLNGYLKELLYFDVAANIYQVQYLLNRYFNPYSRW